MLTEKRPQDSPTPAERKRASVDEQLTVLAENSDYAWSLPNGGIVNYKGLKFQTLDPVQIWHRMFYNKDGVKTASRDSGKATLDYSTLIRIEPKVIKFEEGKQFANIYINRIVPGKSKKREPLYVSFVDCSFRDEYSLSAETDKFGRTKISVPICILRGGELNENLEALRKYMTEQVSYEEGSMVVRTLVKPNNTKKTTEADMYNVLWCSWPKSGTIAVTVDGTNYHMTSQQFNQYCLDGWYDFTIEISSWAMKVDDKCEVGWSLNLQHINVRRPTARKNDKIDLQAH